MASTFGKRGVTVRLNIYLPNSDLRRVVKAAAAKQDVSISEYCVRAITHQLKRDREEAPTKKTRLSLASAVDSARRFQADTFRGKAFKVSSAALIRQTREQRPA